MRTVEIVTNGKTYLVVETAEMPNRVELVACDMKEYLRYTFSQGKNTIIESIELPEAYYEFIGFASSLCEKEWAGIVDFKTFVRRWSSTVHYADYTNDKSYFLKATESGKSWLEANGIADFVNPFLLIKK